MVDVTLILPTAQVQNIGAGGQHAQNATQTGVPAPLRLSPGALVTGVIVGNDANGSYFLKTDQGTVNLRSNVPLTYNSDVLIRVDTTSGSNANARIISVNGEAYSTFSAPAAQEADSLSSSLLAKTQTSAPIAPDMQTSQAKSVAIQAVTIAPTTAQNSAISAPPLPVPAGTPVILYAAQPSAQSASSSLPNQTNITSPQQPVSIAKNIPVLSTQTPQTTFFKMPDAVPSNVSKLIVAQPQALAQTTAGGILSALSPTPPATLAPAVIQNNQYALYSKTANASPPTSAPATLPPQLAASVISDNADGTFTLLTSQGTVNVKPESLPSTLPLPTGTSLTLSLPTLSSFSTLANADLPQDSLATTLKQIFSFINTSTPSAATDLLAKLPSVGTDFLSSSITFTASLLRGNARKILGESVITTLTHNGGGDLVEKFTSQTTRAAQAFSAPAEQAPTTSNWQSFSLPYLYQGAIDEARLYIKREPPKKSSDNTKKTTSDTRFVVEISFSDLGELQLDGLVLPRETSTIFDLIVRTQVPFTPEERTDIINIYNSAAELTGFKGAVNFYVSKDFPVKPLAEMIAATTSDIIA